LPSFLSGEPRASRNAANGENIGQRRPSGQPDAAIFNDPASKALTLAPDRAADAVKIEDRGKV
jgi:hypothetical protein